jgi:hypothetical protein
MGEKAQSRVLGTDKRTVKTFYQVVPRDGAPKIELFDSEELRKQVLLSVKLESVSQQKNGFVSVQFKLTAAPCDLAFNVFLQTDKGETRVGSISCAKGNGTNYETGNSNAPKPLPARVKLILRSSADVAKDTVELNAIYSGEIVFPDVPVKQETY